MFLIKIFHFLKGYVILYIWGKNKEEFTDELLHLGVVPYEFKSDEKGFFVTVSTRDFFKIRYTKARPNIRIVKKCGGVFLLKKIRKRKFFVLGALIFILSFVIGSNFLWSVEIEGVKNCDAKRLESAVELAGIVQGAHKKSLKTPIEMKNIILANTDDICWAWVYIKGTKAVVKIREDIIPPEVFDKNVPCDVIAMRNGIIKNVVTKHGKCVVSENQAVAAGDTIISGTFQFENQPGYQVHASGEVYAYTTHNIAGTYKKYYCYKTYSGRKRRIAYLNIYGKNIPLTFSCKVDFEEYDLTKKNYDLSFGRENYVGVGLAVEEYSEFTTQCEQLSDDSCRELAASDLERKISEELLPGAKLLDKKVEVVDIDSETIRVELTMEFVEQIGTEKQIDEVTFIEPKTDKSAAGG